MVEDLPLGVALGEAERLSTRVGEGAESRGVSTTAGLERGTETSAKDLVASVSGIETFSSAFFFSRRTWDCLRAYL